MYLFSPGLRSACNVGKLKFFSKFSSISACNCLQNIRPYTLTRIKLFPQIRQTKINCNIFKKPYCSGQPKYLEASNQKVVGYWLLTCSGMVFVAVGLGGVTRLTESGLSMVTWKFFGETPPMTVEQWQEEFEKYKQYPEFKLKNKEISLEDFKWIWRMEYFHRMWGRVIGLAFFVPAIIFYARKRFSTAMLKRVPIMGTLLLSQGLLGWYMVRSGLENKFEGPNDVPRVSQYRLAAHLTLAFVLYASLLRAALENLSPALHWPIMSKSIVPFKILAHSSKGLVYLTAISGAFVAGLDAGLIYNSFPKMADKWVPDDAWYMAPFYKNFFENPSTVQFDHRILGTTTMSFITAVWLLSFRLKLPPGARFATNAFGIMAYTQVALGITTLLTYVPVYLAAMHQCGSLVLLSLATWLTHELKHIKKLAR